MNDTHPIPDGGMTAEEYFSRPVPVRTEPEDVARAIRYMEWWLPVGKPSLGLATESALATLLEFARLHGGCTDPLHEWQCPACGATTRARMADHPDQRPRQCDGG